MSPALGPPDFADNTKIVDELHDRLVDLHDGMPASVSMVDVRLLSAMCCIRLHLRCTSMWTTSHASNNPMIR